MVSLDSAVTKEELGSTFPLRTSEAVPSSNVESSQKETAKTSAEVEEKPDSKSFHLKTDSSVPPVNVHSRVPLLAKREHNGDKPSCNPVNFQVLPELCLDSGWVLFVSYLVLLFLFSCLVINLFLVLFILK